MKFDIYVFNTPSNAWVYTYGYINALRKMGLLCKSGDIELWHDIKNYDELFNGDSEYILMIAPEHHRNAIFGTTEHRDKILSLKEKTKKKLIALCFESLVDPFGACSWAVSGNRWFFDNLNNWPHKSAQWQTTNNLAEQFKCFDYVFAHDEVDVGWFNNNNIKAFWIPTCADPDMFKPVSGKPLNRAAFIGRFHWPRTELINKYPFKFDVITEGPRASFGSNDSIRTTEIYVTMLGSFLIGVNMRSPFAGITTRTFELMACGIIPIAVMPAPNRAFSIEILNSLKHVLVFNEWSINDSNKIKDYYNYAINNTNEIIQRGMENRQTIIEKYTPIHRIDEISKIIEHDIKPNIFITHRIPEPIKKKG